MKKPKLINIIGIITVIFILIPLIMIAITAFGNADIIRFPIDSFTTKWFFKVFESRSFMESLKTSLLLGLIASFLGIVFALPTAYALYKMKGRFSKHLLSFFLSPNLIPGIVLGIMLYRIIVLNFQLNLELALVIGHLLLVLPYSIRVLSSGLKEFDPNIEEAAISLGATRGKAFYLTIMPYLKNSILAAFMMSFINSFNNLPVSMYLKGPGVNTLPVTLMNYIEYNFDPSVSALSLILMVFTFLLMRFMDRVLGIKKVM
ncbi:MAG: ABC transporter permease [Tissierellia bacterium]|nr:ABC transporter permease [Tissierellia bacterium]